MLDKIRITTWNFASVRFLYRFLHHFLTCCFSFALFYAWSVKSCFLCSKTSLKVGPSGRFTSGPPSVHRRGAITPWRWTFDFCRYFSRYKFELRLPFSRQRCSLEISSALQRSSNARLTVEQDSRSSAEIVRIPGQHLPSLSARSRRYIYTALARWLRSDR